jgi:hypothetical protein
MMINSVNELLGVSNLHHPFLRSSCLLLGLEL